MNGDYLKLYTKNWEQVVFVPFICKRCGKCCREVSVDYRLFNGHRVAKHLRISFKEAETRVLKHFNQHPSNKPCLFFIADKKGCSIYRVRPSVCRSYPLYTDAGSMGIDCPGKIERIKLYEGLAPDCAGTKNKTPICPEVWEEILRKLDSINVSDKIKRKFITINEREVTGRKK